MTKIYAIAHDVAEWDVMPCPSQLLALANTKKRDAAKAPANVELDSRSSIGRAERLLLDYVERGYVATEKQGGDDRTYALCAEVLSLGLSENKAFELIDTIWNVHCEPPWAPDELATKIANAGRYAQNEAGCDAVAPVTERIPSDALEKLLAESAAQPSAPVKQTEAAPHNSYPLPKLASELANGSFPTPWYVWHPFMLGGHVNLNSGDGGAGKTLLALNLAVATAAGLPLFGYATRQMPVLLILAEDDFGVTKANLEKICKALGLNLADLPIRIWCLPGCDTSIAVVQDDGPWTPGPFMAPLRAELAAIGGPALLILDTVSDVAVLDETKRLAVNSFCKQVLGGLCRDFGATILVNAHPSKAAMADGSGYAGSTAWNNAVRNRLTLERPDPKSRQRILRVAKANYGNEAELELQMVDGVFWQRDQGDAAEADARLMTACVAAAEAAAKQGTPVQKQRRPPKWVFDMIERDVGRRPTIRELREVLDYAQRAGRVRFLMGTSKRVAGYYPWDEQRAAELAAEAKKHSATVAALSAAADKREANNG